MMLNRLKPCLLHSCFDVSYIPVVQKLTVHDQGDPDTEEILDSFVASRIYCFYCLFIMVYYLMHYVKPKQNKILVSEIIMINTSFNHKKNKLLILITWNHKQVKVYDTQKIVSDNNCVKEGYWYRVLSESRLVELLRVNSLQQRLPWPQRREQCTPSPQKRSVTIGLVPEPPHCLFRFVKNWNGEINVLLSVCACGPSL